MPHVSDLPPPLAFTALIERYWTALTRAPESERELRSKRTIIERHLTAAFAHLTVPEIDAAALDGYKRRKRLEGLSPKTINNHLSVVRSILRFAMSEGAVAHVPDVPNLELASSATDFLERDAARRLLAATEGELHAMILLALRAGLRLAELRALRWTDIDFGTATLHVRVDAARGQGNPVARELPLSPKTAEVLQALPRRSSFVFSNASGSRLSHGACKWPLYRAAQRAGLEAVGWQVLRNTFTRELVMRNVSVRAVQSLLGCRSSAPVLRYVPTAEDSERAAILLLDVRDGITSARTTRWHSGRASAPPDLSFFVFVSNDRRERARLRGPRLGGLDVPVLPSVTGLEPTN